MRMILNSVLFVLLSSTAISAEIEPIRKVELPNEVKYELRQQDIPKEIQGKVWNRWTSDNFVVLSLHDVQAQYLHQHLEAVKVWAYSRWGFYDIDFSAECKLICVDDPAIFEKMFGLTKTKVEIRRDANGKITQSVIFLLINDAPSHTVPTPLTEVCLAEFSQKYDANFNWWTYRGMALLNGALDQIERNLSEFVPIIESNQPIFFSEGLFKMTKEQYMALPQDKQRLYDNCAMLFCLMLRKEFGQDKFHWFLKKSSEVGPESALKEVLGFQSLDDFNRTFKRYIIDLMRDIRDKKTPPSYLQIREATSSPSPSAFSS